MSWRSSRSSPLWSSGGFSRGVRGERGERGPLDLGERVLEGERDGPDGRDGDALAHGLADEEQDERSHDAEVQQQRMHQAEAALGASLGHDAAECNNSRDMFEVMKFASLLQKVNRMDPVALPAEVRAWSES